MRNLSILVLTATCILPAAQGANFSGKWALGAAGRGGETVLTLNQVGNEVFGTLGSTPRNGGSGAPANREVIDGKVNGDVITFYVWTGNDVPAKQMYKGTMSGDEITFEITGGPTRGGGGGFGAAGASGRGGGGAPGASGRGGAGRGPAGPTVAHRVK